MLGNFVSRVCKLSAKNFGDVVPDGDNIDTELADKINEKLVDLTNALEKCEFRDAVFALRSLWAIANEYMTIKEPWALVKNGDMKAAANALNECFQLIDLFARVSAPFIPDAAEKIQNVFENKHDLSWPTKYEHRITNGEKFVIPENLFNRIELAEKTNG
jgi:methionyl-tRNA synthetase